MGQEAFSFKHSSGTVVKLEGKLISSTASTEAAAALTLLMWILIG